jgi:hypothetical protein
VQNTGVREERSDRRFYLGASLAIVIAVFVGFAPTYYLRQHFQTASLPLVDHIHGLVFTGWIVLFVAQAVLIAVRRIDLHRRLGVAGAALACAVVALGLLTATVSGRRSLASGNAGALTFLAIPFTDMLVFGALAAAGLWYRRHRDTHKRLMFLATISLLGAAFARWPFAVVASTPAGFFTATDLFIVAALAHDLVSERRLHPANLWGGLVIVVSQPLRLAMAGTPAWLAIARGVLG